MQDFNYEHSNCFEITVELTCCKHPLRSELINEWESNKESLLAYLEAVHSGAKGIISDENTGEPIPNANINIGGIAKTIYRYFFHNLI